MRRLGIGRVGLAGSRYSRSERDASPPTCEMTGVAASHSNALRSGASICFAWNENDYRLVWTSHHALFDGRSRVILLHELFALYDASLSGTTSVA